MFDRLLTTLLLLMFLVPASGQKAPPSVSSQQPSATAPVSLMDWLQKLPVEVVHFQIKTDLNPLLLKKEEVYQPATITINDTNNQARSSWNIEIRTRGNSRKKMCFYPPLKLKFRKKELQAAGLNDQFTVLRLINQCESSALYKKYLEKEYLAYQLYSLVDTFSLRSRLAVITFIDAAGNNKPVECQAFLLEDEKEMAARFQGKMIKKDKYSYHLTDRPAALTMSVFQYMIGNTDFSISNLHNLFLLDLPDHTNTVPVPYDFDFSGLVNAHYASPHSSLPISSIRDRWYRGPSCTDKEVTLLATYFLEHQTAIMDYCARFPFSDNRSKRDVTRYLEDFFDQLRNDQLIRKQFSGK